MTAQIITKAAGLVAKHSPEILTGAGVAAVVGGTVLTARATLKSGAIIDEHVNNMASVQTVMDLYEKGELREGTEYTKKDIIQDKVVIYRKTGVAFFKLYAVPVTLTAAGIGAILWSHKILRDREAGALAAAAVISKAFEQYRDNVKADLGVEADEAFHTGRKVKVTEDGKVETGERDPKLDTRIRVLYDETNAKGTWERSEGMNYIRVNHLQNIMNDRLKYKDTVFLNEVLDALGMEKTHEGQIMGWSKKVNPDSYIDFGLGYTDDPGVLAFTNGDDPSVWLTFNTDGLIWDRF